MRTFKLSDNCEIVANNYGAVISGQEIVGPTATAQWDIRDYSGLMNIVIQNKSTGWIEISTDSGASNGFRIPSGVGFSIDLSDDFQQSFYAVNSEAAFVLDVSVVFLLSGANT